MVDRGDERQPIVVELNLLHAKGLPRAAQRFKELYEATLVQQFGLEPLPEQPVIGTMYVPCELSKAEMQALVKADSTQPDASVTDTQDQGKHQAIYRIWPDFEMKPQIDRSVATIKADAARRSFGATGQDITWAVIDSGILGTHPHFEHYRTLQGNVEQLHMDFTGGQSPLTDALGHGSHVAGIIAGGLRKETLGDRGVRVAERIVDQLGDETVKIRTIPDPERLAGVAPECKLVSLKVTDVSVAGHQRSGRSSNVISALEYVRHLNGNGKLQLIHGVNVSLGYEFDARWFACGQSPLCVEIDRLVRSGVVVVVAAGNTGYGLQRAEQRGTDTGLSLTINDPGNASLAITVGATHRDAPHTFGVSYFSSKGPTGDGRLKPDLVAPGEHITSCAVGEQADQMAPLIQPGEQVAAYIDADGTSMAAPHVSGTIATFLSIRREFIGRPDEVKRIFMDSATSLGREQYFQGRGLIDLMRAIQAV